MQGRDFCEDQRPPAPWQRTGDFTLPDDDPQDELGHGTAVAGILGAATNNAIGMASVTWSGNIFPARVAVRPVNSLTAEVSSIANTDEEAKAIKWAGTFSHVINISMTTRHNSKHLRLAVEYAFTAGCHDRRCNGQRRHKCAGLSGCILRQLQPSQVKIIIEQTANRNIPPPVGLPWPNSVYGHGIVDARAAVDRVLDGPLPPP